jgi:hypothetical protein
MRLNTAQMLEIGKGADIAWIEARVGHIRADTTSAVRCASSPRGCASRARRFPASMANGAPFLLILQSEAARE